MLYTALGFFLLAALIGIYLLTFILKNKNTPKGLAFTHGGIAGTGLIILIVYALIYHPSPIISIILFILAVFGGIMLIFRDITGKSIPKWLALAHGFTALIAFTFLIIFTFS